MKQDK